MWTWKRIFAHLKTFAAVTAITLLIWLYAEAENIRSHDMRFSVEFVPPARRGLVVKSPPQPVVVQMSFRSNLGQFAQVQRRTQAGPIRYQLADDAEAASYAESVNLRDWLANNSPLASMGINIDDVRPPALAVAVERAKANSNTPAAVGGNAVAE